MIHIFRDTTQIQHWISTALVFKYKAVCLIFYPCNVGIRLSLLETVQLGAQEGTSK